MESNQHGHSLSRKDFLKLSAAALGVVFGDIGTSPLYAIKECFAVHQGLSATPEHVMGVLSLVFWSLFLVVTLKYLVFILRADNNGEGGILALLALLIEPSKKPERSKLGWFLLMAGLFGAALLYGDGIITPAISVLSAVEGLGIATPAFEPVIVPLTIVILFLLFMVQSKGSSIIGNVFGPATFLWFIAIAATGLPWIIQYPAILGAILPHHAIAFILSAPFEVFALLSSVVLCITGGEALYADMGHFGRGPIRFTWTTLVFPCLLINYFGQGAYILSQGDATNPFYGMVPQRFLIPMVILATAATVIASQALISGAFSLTQQAVQLGYLPRVQILHTSAATEGQIFVPTLNRFLMVGCIAMVVMFKSSSALASAYGIAVTGTMSITTILFMAVARWLWNWPIWRIALTGGIFLTIDLLFLSANFLKILTGGWMPILLALFLFAMMTTWKRGRLLMSQLLARQSMKIPDFIAQIERDDPYRVDGTAVFLTLNPGVAPVTLNHHYRHNRCLHRQVVLLSIVTDHSPVVQRTRKLEAVKLPQGIWKIIAHYGYMETPRVMDILKDVKEMAPDLSIDRVSFFLGRESIVISSDGPPTPSPIGQIQLQKFAAWRKPLFVFMSKNARPASDFFGLPPDQVIEIGAQVRI